MTSSDDFALLRRLKAGDEEAFDALFRAHYPTLVGVAEVITRDRMVGEEIAQDVMLELWRRRDSLVIAESARAYLVRATRNRALNHIRHDRVRKTAEPHLQAAATPVAEAHEGAAEHELSEAITAAYNDLPPRCREVFELSRVHGLKYSEIASTLGISVKTVETQMGRALKTMRERLKDWGR